MTEVKSASIDDEASRIIKEYKIKFPDFSFSNWVNEKIKDDLVYNPKPKEVHTDDEINRLKRQINDLLLLEETRQKDMKEKESLKILEEQKKLEILNFKKDNFVKACRDIYEIDPGISEMYFNDYIKSDLQLREYLIKVRLIDDGNHN